MIKCPNCGSTAQVEFDDYIDDFCGTIQAHYNCGCGCHFHISHYASSAIYIDNLKKEKKEKEIKCPTCDSTAQVELQLIDHMECSRGICTIRYYKCGCGKHFDSTQWFKPDKNGEKIGDFTW